MEISPPIALTSMKTPPNRGLCFTTTEPTIARIENNKANQPKVEIEEAPSAPKALPRPPTAKAIREPKNPKIPPRRPSTNSVVLFPMNYEGFMVF